MANNPSPCHDLYFIGTSGDPLNAQIIGFEDTRPLLYKFETRSSNDSGNTTVSTHAACL
jgi:hypothetical protein